jgi:hypothetical protein
MEHGKNVVQGFFIYGFVLVEVKLRILCVELDFLVRLGVDDGMRLLGWKVDISVRGWRPWKDLLFRYYNVCQFIPGNSLVSSHILW